MQTHDPKPDRGEDLAGFVIQCIAWAIFVVALAVVLAIAMTGCATYKVDTETGEGSSYGFLRNISAATKTTTTTAPDGSITIITEEAVTSTSTTADLMLGLDKLLGTAAGIAEKAKP